MSKRTKKSWYYAIKIMASLSHGQGEITFPPHNKFINLPDLIIPTLTEIQHQRQEHLFDSSIFKSIQLVNRHNGYKVCKSYCISTTLWEFSKTAKSNCTTWLIATARCWCLQTFINVLELILEGVDILSSDMQRYWATCRVLGEDTIYNHLQIAQTHPHLSYYHSLSQVILSFLISCIYIKNIIVALLDPSQGLSCLAFCFLQRDDSVCWSRGPGNAGFPPLFLCSIW